MVTLVSDVVSYISCNGNYSVRVFLLGLCKTKRFMSSLKSVPRVSLKLVTRVE